MVSAKATRDELSGSALTVTSLGRLGGIVSTSVTNHPEVAIVRINRIVARPMVREVRDGTAKHEADDEHVLVIPSPGGGRTVAAACVQRVLQLLESPATLFIG